MYHLENVHISSDYNHLDCRFPVQTVIRPHTLEHQDYRGFAGQIDGVYSNLEIKFYLLDLPLQ